MATATRLVTSAAALLALAAGSLTALAPAQAAPAPAPATAAASAVPSGWTPRPEVYPKTVTRTDLAIPMSDGVVLRGDVMLPADAAGNAITGRFPVIITITAYNKTVLASSPLGGGSPSYLVKRGYAQLTVDARGTGSSGGAWSAFGLREQKDAGEIVDWAHVQPWSNGNSGMSGPSYMGISQIFAAQNAKPESGLKAIFPQVPAGDVYRDIVASGGQLDVGFMPLWLGLVNLAGFFPTVTMADPAAGLAVLLEHFFGTGVFSMQMMLEALLGGETAYDGPFYRERAPLTNIAKVTVPAFFVSGEYDLFQRGTPLDFEALQKNGVPTKLIIGPWDHLEGSSGAEIGEAGYGSLAELQLRWFDKYVRGVSDPALDSDIAPLTYYELGSGVWRTAPDWIGARHGATSFKLSGAAATGGKHGALTLGMPAAGTADVLPIPVQGLCTRSASQWTAGAVNVLLAENPCNTNNAWNDALGVVFETAPMTEALAIQGPINAHLNVSTPSGDGMLAVAVSDVAPDGTVSRLTGGWQVISHRALDTTRSRYLDGQLIQPWHPFTKEAKAPASGVVPVDVEVFPTGAKILPGHRLRLSVQAFDVPHLLPTLPDLLGTLTVLKIHTSADRPSLLTVPSVKAASVTRGSLRYEVTKPRTDNKVKVAVPGGTGRVKVYVDGVLRRTLRLLDGRAATWLDGLRKRGEHRVVVKYLGDARHLPSRKSLTWRVR